MIVVVPSFTPVIIPEEDTVATLSSTLLHCTFLFVASAGNMVADNVTVFPSSTERAVEDSWTPVTAVYIVMDIEGEDAVAVYR